jgi:peptidoglycan/xylan/chitin deacetylase (PgdA/CDA1 family)
VTEDREAARRRRRRQIWTRRSVAVLVLFLAAGVVYVVWPQDSKAPEKKALPKSRPHAIAPVRAVDGRMPNELGVVPVIMHHEIRPDRVGDFDQTPAELRAELAQLWRRGYWPVTDAQLVDGDLGSVPAGKTPVVLTFDDSTQFQFSYLPDGRIRPTTAIAVLLAFARKHPGFKPTGTFYILREPFAGVPQGPAMLRWLVAHGFELGDHTQDHIPLNTLGPTDVQRELVLGARLITDAVTGYRIRTMALPLGAMPKPASLARRGSWGGESYQFDGVFLAGAEPALSPFRKDFDRGAIPRIRSSHRPWNGEADFTWAFWQHRLDQAPADRYVSDGEPSRVTFPRRDSRLLARRFRGLARPY